MKTFTASPWLRRSAVALLSTFSLAAIACNGETLPTATGTPSGIGTQAPTESQTAETVIEFTTDGFVPDQIDAQQGSRVMLRNTTDSPVTFVIQGRENGAPGDERTVEPGESVDLELARAGAYILTLTDDPLVSVGVFIS